jgi:hypothetical protein
LHGGEQSAGFEVAKGIVVAADEIKALTAEIPHELAGHAVGVGQALRRQAHRFMNQGVINTPSATSTSPPSGTSAHTKPTASTCKTGLSIGMPAMRLTRTLSKCAASAATRRVSASGVVN